MPGALLPAPIITNNLTYSLDPRRHIMREVLDLSRDPIFRDLFTRMREMQRPR